ncbi:RCC1 domain-containing protein [Candidatus Venteria ishoeyi]|uniref:Regulator of chromosome condensation (RCC1) repeat protein n=1 Tax=Candidatus Venteria ishoeyi TaxID=1899563 RepID=A0A1H6F7T0_9GAMM|nr:Ig-like domain-containing protein [Candidatus Venteria ishoeyi]SEH05106.1 Regulator of chromosome condensation (RCC1) repeat protein [Candidatus Venteria ishoeyi]
MGVNNLAVSVGGNQSCAIVSGGAVKCWLNGVAAAKAINITGLSANVIGLSSGQQHHCAVQKIAQGQQLSCWSDDDNATLFGQLGDGYIAASSIPIRPLLPDTVQQAQLLAFSAGNQYTCALFNDQLGQRQTYCWGQNHQGQLGDGSGIDRLEPTLTGSYQSKYNPLQNMRSLSLAENYACALDDAGQVKCWGNIGEQRDYAETGSWQYRFDAHNVSDTLHASQISTGSQHTCVISTLDQENGDNSIYCWGANEAGQLGNSSTQAIQQPEPVALVDAQWQDLSLGLAHSCAISSNGSLYCWGDNQQGQSGLGSVVNSKRPLLALENVSSPLLAHQNHSCVQTVQGLLCTGDNARGQLGIDNTRNANRFLSVATDIGETQSLVAGLYHQCALSIDGQVSCWGDNSYGQLGDGSSDASQVPLSLTLSNITKLSAGRDHTCTLDDSGQVFCWGNNRFGQVGNGSSENQNEPVMIMSGVSQIVLGKQHSCTLHSGLVSCWGNNSVGQLGQIDRKDKLEPTLIANLIDIKNIYAAGDYSCATNQQGQIACWGDNSHGQLGNGTRLSSAEPVLVHGPNAPVIAEGERVAVTIPVTAAIKQTEITLNASDVDGDELTWVQATQAQSGIVSLTVQGDQAVISYLAGTGFFGKDRFDILVEDGKGGQDTITIVVTVADLAAPVFAQGSTLSLNLRPEQPVKPLVVDLNVSSEAEPVSWRIKTQAQRGITQLQSDNLHGQVTYTPTAEQLDDAVQIVIEVKDAQQRSSSITLNITISDNAIPVITQGQSISMNITEKTSLVESALTLSATDKNRDNLSWHILTVAQYGNAELLTTSEGNSVKIGYQPTLPLKSETDMFTVEVNDGHGGTAQIKLNVAIQDLNNAPVIEAGANSGGIVLVSMDEDSAPTPFELTLFASDEDSNEQLTWSIVKPADSGQVSFDYVSDNQHPGDSIQVNYKPEANFNGQDNFTLKVSDSRQDEDTIVVTVNVGAIDDIPVISVEEQGRIRELALGETVTISAYEEHTNLNLIFYANGQDSSSFSWQTSSSSSKWYRVSQIEIVPENDVQSQVQVNLTLEIHANGKDSFTLTVTDDKGSRVLIPVVIIIIPRGDPPYLEAAKEVHLRENDTQVKVPLSALDVDGDGNGFQWSIVEDAQHNTEAANDAFSGSGRNAEITYTPTSGYHSYVDKADNGIDDRMLIQAKDDDGTNKLQVQFKINPINDRPVLTSFDGAALQAENHITIDEDHDTNASHEPKTRTIPVTVFDADHWDIEDKLTWMISTAAQHGIATVPEQTEMEPTAGKATIDPNQAASNYHNTISYTPNTDYHGEDSFEVTVTDEGSRFDSVIGDLSITFTVNVTINPINDTPIFNVAQVSNISLTEDRSRADFNLSVIADWFDASSTENDFSWALTTAAGQGTVSGISGIGLTKSVNYRPTATLGADTFTVTVSDTRAGNLGVRFTVKMNIHAGTLLPEFEIIDVVSLLTVVEDTSMDFNVIASDAWQDENHTINWVASVPDEGGTVTGATATGNSKVLSYTPELHFPHASTNGTETFTVTIDDTLSQTLNVVVTVTPVNDAPVIQGADPATFNAKENSQNDNNDDGGRADDVHSMTFTVIDYDNDPLTWTVQAAPSNGTMGYTTFDRSQNMETTTTTVSTDLHSVDVHYQGNQRYVGADNFVLKVSDRASGDAELLADTVSVDVDVAITNRAPTIVGSSTIRRYLAVGTASHLFNINSQDLDGDSVTWSVVTPPTKGSINIANPLVKEVAVTYTPNNPNAAPALDSFVLRVTDDPHGWSNTVTVYTGITRPPTLTAGGAFLGSIDITSISTFTCGNRTLKKPGSLQTKTVSYTFRVSEDNGDTIAWSITGSQSSVSISANKSWNTPYVVSGGGSSITVSMSNNAGSPISNAYVHVEAIDSAGQISSGGYMSGNFKDTRPTPTSVGATIHANETYNDPLITLNGYGCYTASDSQNDDAGSLGFLNSDLLVTFFEHRSGGCHGATLSLSGGTKLADYNMNADTNWNNEASCFALSWNK